MRLNGSSIASCVACGKEKVMSLIRRFALDCRAATSIEYAIIGCAVSIAIIAGVRAVGQALQAKFYGPIASNLS
jgi:Flp pilus assembly pilin Flp